MFHLDFTMEDIRIIAREVPLHAGEDSDICCEVTFMALDVIHRKRMKMIDVLRILTVGMSLDGESTVSTTYTQVDEFLADCPPECRPIP